MRKPGFSLAMLIAVLAAMAAGAPLATAATPKYTAPYTVEVFVRGTFNGWGLGHEMKFDTSRNLYLAYVELTPGPYEFKIASEDWATVDLGYAGDDPAVQIGVPKSLASLNYQNLYLWIDTPGVYSFKFDVSNPANLTLLVEYARGGGDGTQVYQQAYTGQSWSFDCLGSASPLVGDIVVKGALHSTQNAAGGAQYKDNQVIDGRAFDQAGNEYRLHMTRPLNFEGKPNTSYTYSETLRANFVSQGSGLVLNLDYTYKITVGAAGDVKREFYFESIGCAR